MSDRDILTDPQWKAFQRQLDAQPDSHATRAVLADWLEGQGHPWARAYRWMARMEKWPIEEGVPMFAKGWYTTGNLFSRPTPSHAVLPVLYPPSKEIEDLILAGLKRANAELLLCELFDELPLEGKEDDQPQPRTYEQRAAYACKVCGNVPDEDGMIEHGRGCFVASEDGGGTSFTDMGNENA